MSIFRLRWSPAAAAVGLLMILPAGCAVEGVGYSGGYGYGADYYDGGGYDYGGWGDGYYVGPYRNGGYRGGDHDRGGHDRGGHDGGHAYRSAPASHGVPSIPSGGRGGAHAGGGRTR